MVKAVISGADGKMGRVLADIILKRDDIKVIGGIDIAAVKYADFDVVSAPNKLAEKPDVIIDFSHPSALDSLLDYCLTNGTALAVATTGYTDEQKAEIKKASAQIPVFFTFNMSIGINLLCELSKSAVRVLGEQFDVEIVEKHHNQKIDAPSGTALMLADAISAERECESRYVYERHSVRQKRAREEIGIHSIRGGTIVGEHDVIFAGRDEVITLSHHAASKEVFAVGAVNAAVFLASQGAGLYDMKDLLRANG